MGDRQMGSVQGEGELVKKSRWMQKWAAVAGKGLPAHTRASRADTQAQTDW